MSEFEERLRRSSDANSGSGATRDPAALGNRPSRLVGVQRERELPTPYRYGSRICSAAAVSSPEAFGPRPSAGPTPSRQIRHPKPFTGAAIGCSPNSAGSGTASAVSVR